VGEKAAPAFFVHYGQGEHVNLNRAQLGEELEARLSGLGYELVQLEWAGGPRRPVIRLRVEREALDRPVSLDDCTTVSRGIEAWLDRDARVPESYVLEVSSPGLERPLTRDKDFRRFRGHRIAVTGTGALRGRSSHLEGELLGLFAEGGETASIRLRLQGGDEIDVPTSLVASARLVHEWRVS